MFHEYLLDLLLQLEPELDFAGPELAALEAFAVLLAVARLVAAAGPSAGQQGLPWLQLPLA